MGAWSEGGGRESQGHQDRSGGLWTARERRTLRLALEGPHDSGAAGSRIAQKRGPGPRPVAWPIISPHT